MTQRPDGKLGHWAWLQLSHSLSLSNSLHSDKESSMHRDHSKVTQRCDRPRASSIQHCITLRQLTRTDTLSTWTFEILSRMGIQQQPKLW